MAKTPKDLIGLLREAHFSEGFTCPRCHSSNVVRWGKERLTSRQHMLADFQDLQRAFGIEPKEPAPVPLQRYRCRSCRHTFNDRTGTPMARTRLPDKWERFAQCMKEQRSCRSAGRALHVNFKTTFYWRHKILNGLSAQDLPEIGGLVEADEKWFRRSYKGSVPPGRKSRKRGGKTHLDGSPRGLGRNQVAVLVARNRDGLTVPMVFDRFNGKAVLERFGPILDPKSILCTDGSKILRAFGRRMKVEHHVFVASKREFKRGILHIQNVNAYHSRLENWMLKFNGVATKYLPNYMAWHVFFERAQHLTNRAAREILLVDSSSLPAQHRADRCPHCGKSLMTKPPGVPEPAIAV